MISVPRPNPLPLKVAPPVAWTANATKIRIISVPPIPAKIPVLSPLIASVLLWVRTEFATAVPAVRLPTLILPALILARAMPLAVRAEDPPAPLPR